MKMITARRGEALADSNLCHIERCRLIERKRTLRRVKLKRLAIKGVRLIGNKVCPIFFKRSSGPKVRNSIFGFHPRNCELTWQSLSLLL